MRSPFGSSPTALAVWGSMVLALAVPVATQGPGVATVTVNGAEAVARDVLVKFAAPLNALDRQLLNLQVDADRNEQIGSAEIRRIHSRSLDTETLIAFLQTDSRVAYAEPNYILHAITVPDDPGFGQLWGLQNLGQTVGGIPGVPGADISATAAWNISTGSHATV